MGENSKIEWTTHTFNPWIGCQKVSPGCDHCYAETQNNFRKWNGGTWGPHAPRTRTSEANWRKPLQWAREAGIDRPRVFCASLADIFDNQAPPAWRMDLFALIECTPELDWLLLTKRPENIRKMAPIFWQGAMPNVWLGTTCEDQEHYDRRWSILMQVPAAVRFISYEPAIGPLRLPYVRGADCYHDRSAHPDWIICGGESGGPNARYMQPEWAADLKRDCEDRDIAFFMKQMTNKKPIPAELLLRQFPQHH